jgi:hypothetical protein
VNLITRVKNILLEPKAEWPRIAVEAATPQSIYLSYVVILAAIGPLVMLIRMNIVGALVQYVISLAVTLLMALIVEALATTFGGEKNFVQSLKLVAYSYTAAWIAAIFLLIPTLGGVIALLAGLYSLYTFYLGVPVLKKCPQDKAIGYTIVVVICAILAWLLAGFLLSMVIVGSVAGMAATGIR